MNISIVIPHFNNWQMTHNLLFDLYKHEGSSISEIVLVNNGGTDDEISGGTKYWREMFYGIDVELTPIQIKENVGFLLAANLGLKEAEGITKVLISNDVRVRGNFTSHLFDKFMIQHRRLVGQKLYTQDTGWNVFDGKVYPYLEGYFLAAMDLDWEILEYFDVDFAPHIFEDVDLSTKALSLGYELVPLNLPFIEHMAGGTITYNEERHALTRRNQEKFRLKWTQK